jgi:endonuclease YncB( thermonuclease family)
MTRSTCHLLSLAATGAVAAIAHAVALPHTVPPVKVAATPWAPTIHGLARVIDGDTVVVAGTRVRLKGVDATRTAHRAW